MDDEYRIDEIPNVYAIHRWAPHVQGVLKQKRSKEEKKSKRQKGFKDKFLEKFDVNEDKFTVNVVKIDDEWYVEIMNKKTKHKVYQHFDVVCNLLDDACKLPDTLGFNIDERI